ncbi:acetate--CoA ligase family protein [Arthrobacter sp. zg-Y1219]|uniref:acetate--CoA ligase family protein n=1 Tax=Arthrobacter sp. zg-Y1219 TaxID=3049067 RepID=UPI0024C228A8|nr:acetate--CoA ligase family protein [Arthrobacter sp. zg-Y1219]MDK1361696.1 acetate--CoA ligase family protein [Arthrobacter sp. zg-Y1219]
MSTEILDAESVRSADLGPLVAPENIVIIGATDKGPTDKASKDLVRMGFAGPVYPVNPRREELWGGRCYSSIGEVPERPGHVIISVPAKLVPAALRDSIASGARAIAIHAVGFGEGGDPEGMALGAEIRAIAAETDIPIAGPNFGGMFRLDSSLMTISLQRVSDDEGSPVALVGQSGGVLMFTYEALMDRGIAPSTLVASGSELSLSCADYIKYLATDDKTEVIGCFIESVKDIGTFREACELARTNGKRVVVLKVGASPEGRKAALAHTGSVVGSLRAFEALAAELGIVVVHTQDELVDAIEVLLNAGFLPGPRIGVVSHSGGLKDLLMDYASQQGVAFPRLDPATTEALDALLGAGSSVGNPLDTGFPGLANPDIYQRCVRLVAADPNIDVVLVQEELPRTPAKVREERYLRNLSSLARGEDPLPKPVGSMSLSSYSLTDHARSVRRELPGIFVLQEASRALSVVTKIGRAAVVRPRPRHVPHLEADRLRAEIRAKQDSNGPVSLSEYDSKMLLRRYGIPTTSEVRAGSAEDAVTAAEEIGYPVVLKISSETLTHKSDIGGVLLNLGTAEAVRDGFGTLRSNLAAADAGAVLEVLVAEFVSGGTELMLGLARDAEVGSAVAVGSGGITVELFDDIAVGLPPFDRDQAATLLAATKAGTLVSGFRGVSLNHEGVLAAIEGLGRLAVDFEGLIEAIDINPLNVSADRVVALDALVVLAAGN